MSLAFPEPGTHMPRMPPELVDHIIDHLYDDKVTLSTLSTVCRLFYPTASLHLFHDISIDIGCKSMQEFTDFLRDASPHIRNSIGKLRITGSPEIVSLFGRTSKQKLPIAALASLLPHIPYLSELCIHSVNIEGSLTLPPCVPRTLERLSISCVRTAGGPVDICILLTLFSDIGTLHIGDTSWGQLRPDPEGAARQIDTIQQSQHPGLFPSTKVTNLDMSASLYTRSFLEILRRTHTTSSLTRVDVICSNMLEVWSLGDFLGHAGQNVEHLVFNITRLYEGEIPEIADHVRKCLSVEPSCPALKTLTLKLKLDLLNPWATPAMFATIPCLVQHSPSSLRTIVIELELPLSTSASRRACEEREIIQFADKEISLVWSYLALISEMFSSYDVQLIWTTGSTHTPDVADILTSIVRKKIPDCKVQFASCATSLF